MTPRTNIDAIRGALARAEAELRLASLALEQLTAGSQAVARAEEGRLLFSVEEAGHLLGIGRTRMFALVREGLVESVKVGRSRRVPKAAIEEFAERLRTVGL